MTALSKIMWAQISIFSCVIPNKTIDSKHNYSICLQNP